MGIHFILLQRSQTEQKCTPLSLCCSWLLPELMKESSMEPMLPPLLLLHGKYPFNKVEVTSAEELSSQQPMSCLPVTAKSTDSLADTPSTQEELTTITLSSLSAVLSPLPQELSKLPPSQQQVKNSPETPSSPDGERPRELESEATPSQPPSNG